MRIIRIEIRGLVGGREGCEEELYVLIPIFLLPSYSLSSRFFPTTECFMDLDKLNLLRIGFQAPQKWLQLTRK